VRRKATGKKAARRKPVAKKKVTRARAPAKSKRKNAGPADLTSKKIVTALGEVDFEHKTITNSMRGTLENCLAKGFWEYGHRLAQRGIVDYFWVGGIAHAEWERMYERAKFLKKPFLKRLDAETREALKHCINEDQTDKVWKGSAMLGGMIPAYAEYYLARDLDEYEVVATECKFPPIPIPGTDWSYMGMRDMLVRERSSGQLGLWENKTTGQIDAGYVARLPLDFQILGYVWATEQHDGEEVDFIEYNVAQKSRLRGRQGETFGALLDRIEADYRTDPTKYFYRERVPFDRSSIDRFTHQLGLFVSKLEWVLKNGIWTQNTNQCTIRGICPYMPLCLGGPTKANLSMYRQKAVAHEELEDAA